MGGGLGSQQRRDPRPAGEVPRGGPAARACAARRAAGSANGGGSGSACVVWGGYAAGRTGPRSRGIAREYVLRASSNPSAGRAGYRGPVTLVEQDGRPHGPSRGDRSVVDWSAAAQIAGRLARPGPQASRAELADLVEGLRTAAGKAVPHVLDVTRMTPVAGTPETLGTVHVVDRPRWARANTEIMASLTTGVTEALVGESGRVPQATALVGAAQVGSVLAVLSSRVLGQFDPYSGQAAAGAGPGRLVLVAPNVLQVERAPDLPPADPRPRGGAAGRRVGI